MTAFHRKCIAAIVLMGLLGLFLIIIPVSRHTGSLVMVPIFQTRAASNRTINHDRRGHGVQIKPPFRGPTVPPSSVGPDGLPAYPKLLLSNSTLCTGQSNLTLMYIYTSKDRRENRDIIRTTYGDHTVRQRWNIRVVFLLGLTQAAAKQGSIPKDLLEEHQKHQDLIIGDFVDSYKNLSYKGLTAFNYITHMCANARYVIKTDDDAIVNVNQIMTWLETRYNGSKRTILGHYHGSYAPFICPRQPKWCVKKEDYPRKLHPRYMSGVGIVFTTDIISDLYKASLEIPIFYIDDVYITGLLGERVKEKTMINWSRYIPFFAGLGECKRKLPVLFAHAHAAGTPILLQCWEEFQKRTPVDHEN